MENKRFEVVASASELVTSPEKSAIRVELQYGKSGQATELVFAEMYWKDGKWNYTRSQVRLDCTKTNAEYVLKAVKAMFESSTKVEKKTESKPAIDLAKLDVSSLDPDVKAALMAALVGEMKGKETPKAKAPAKTDTDIVLETILLNTKKRKVK